MNRKARRAAATSADVDPTSSIPLSQPDRSAPKGKTLIELTSSRHPGSSSSNVDFEEAKWADLVSDRASLKETSQHNDFSDDPIGPAADSLVYTISLSMLHFTFGILVMHQYAMTLDWAEVAQATAKAFVPLYAIVYTLHPRSSSYWVQALFFGLSTSAGGYLIYICNEAGYYAVMQRAPPLAVLWVWSVVELRLEFAAASLLACTACFWYGGYSLMS